MKGKTQLRVIKLKYFQVSEGRPLNCRFSGDRGMFGGCIALVLSLYSSLGSHE